MTQHVTSPGIAGQQHDVGGQQIVPRPMPNSFWPVTESVNHSASHVPVRNAMNTSATREIPVEVLEEQ